MSIKFNGLAGFLLSLAALFGASPSAAQDVCIPPVEGVPYLPGPPNWWEDALPGWPGLDDPRWNTAFLHTVVPGDGAPTSHVSFRALQTSSDLYLSWRVKVDSQLDAFDMLWVAFSPGTGDQDVLLEVMPFDNPTAEPEADFAIGVTTQVRTGAGDWMGVEPPDWLNGTDRGVRVWRHNLVPDDPQGSWAVQMRVPLAEILADGLDLPASFKMRYLVLVSEAAGSGIAYYPSPDLLEPLRACLADSTCDPFDQDERFGPADDWATYRRDLDPPHPDCAGGISLDRSDIGAVATEATCADPDAVLSTRLDPSDRAGNPGSNILCARPHNGTGGPIGMGKIDATFRIANWGSQPDQPNTVDALWRKVNTTPVIGPGIADGAKGDLHFTWELTRDEACDFDPQPPDLGCPDKPKPTRWLHQCMLVELSGVPGLTFTQSSVRRNMEFVEASRFRREAEISVVGLPPLPGEPERRDVYLYVQTDNMPGEVEEEDPDRPQCDVDTSRCIPPLEEDVYSELRKTMPTYQVHAFHDTGRTITLRGETFPVLEAQTSFGYFVHHEGGLQGWRHALEGAERIAPNYYRIRVPEGGAATVTTEIEAVEEGGGGGVHGRGRFSFSFHGGFNSVQGTLADGVEGGYSFGADFEYPFRDRFALELFAGYDDFDTAVGGDELLHLSLNLKAYARLNDRLRWFWLAGLGLYDFDSGPSENGYNVGTGLRFPVRDNLWLDATVRYHAVKLEDLDFTFLTAHWGVSRRF